MTNGRLTLTLLMILGRVTIVVTAMTVLPARGPGQSLARAAWEQDNTTSAVREKDLDRVAAIDLARGYTENEVAADMEYKGRLVEIIGGVEHIGKDAMGRMYVTFRIDVPELRSVQAFFDKEWERSLARLFPGELILITGRIAGYRMNVLVNDAAIICTGPSADE